MKDLTTGNISKNILKFTTSLIAANIFQQTYLLIDCIIVGRYLGKEALAAVGASGPIIFALISFVIGIASGGTTVISQYYGAKDLTRVRRTIDTLYIFTFFASVLIMSIGILLSNWIFHLMKLPGEVIPNAKIYLNTFLTGTVLLFGFNGTCAILRGLGDAIKPLIFMASSAILNMILVFLFVGYLHMGISGAAWATVISQGCVFLVAILYLNKTHEHVKLKIRELGFDWSIFRQSVKIGLPSGFQQTFVSFGLIALLRIVSNFGTNVIAAYSVVGRIDNLAMLPAMNFGQAISTFTGQNIGAGKYERIRSGLRSTLGMSAVISCMISVFTVIFRYPLMELFTGDREVIFAGAQYLAIVGSCYLVFSCMYVFAGMLRGAGDTLVPMFITLLSLWLIRIPLAAVLSGRMIITFHHWGMHVKLPSLFAGSLNETGIWISIPIAWFIGAATSFFYYRSGNWVKKSVLNYKE